MLVKFDNIFLFSKINIINISQKLTMPRLRVFVMCEIGLAKIYSCTKFDVSIFTHQDLRKRG